VCSTLTPQLRAEEVELQDRNSVLRKSSGGKVNVSYRLLSTSNSQNFSSFLQTVMSEKIRALRKSFDSGGRVAPQPQPSMGELRSPDGLADEQRRAACSARPSRSRPSFSFRRRRPRS